MTDLNQQFQQAADGLWQAEQTLTPCQPIRELFSSPLTLQQAYQIQNINTERRLQLGHRLVGRKIGLTSTAVQKQLGVNQPDFGNLYANMVVMEGEPIKLSSLIQPKIEAELAVVLQKDINHEDVTLMDLIDAIEYVVPAIEIVDSRVQNWQIKIEDTIADNASSALVQIGQMPISLSEIDMLRVLVNITVNDTIVSKGVGANCLGNPLMATRWLAQTMVKMSTPLKAGEVILTGALGPMVTVTEANTYVTDFGEYGALVTEFI